MTTARRLAPPVLRLAPFALAWPMVHGQDDSVPFTAKAAEKPFDAFAEVERQKQETAERGTPRITLMTEFIRISQRDWSKLSRNDFLSGDDSALRREVGLKLKSGHASLLDMSLVSTVSEHTFLSDNFKFHIYPSEFNPPEVDEKNGRIVPVSYAASECWRSGFTARGEATLSADHSVVDLNIAPEFVEMSGFGKTGEGDAGVTNPRFTVQRIYTNLAVTPGDFALAGVFQAHQPDHPERSDEVVLVFFRPTIQVTGPDSADKK